MLVPMRRRSLVQGSALRTARLYTLESTAAHFADALSVALCHIPLPIEFASSLLRWLKQPDQPPHNALRLPADWSVSNSVDGMRVLVQRVDRPGATPLRWATVDRSGHLASLLRWTVHEPAANA